MNLADILSNEQVINDLKATDRWEAIEELIDRLVACGKIRPENRAAISTAVRQREISMGTGIGYGVGIPHASTDLIPEVIGALGRSKNGIDFEATDNRLANLIMLVLVPKGQVQKHLHTLADIAKLLLRNSDLRKAIEEAPGSEAIYQIIKHQSSQK